MFLFIDLKKMIKDIRSKNKWLGLWGQALNFPMLLAPIFFASRAEVWIIFACNLVAIIIAAQIHKKMPFGRLTSICHFAWIPMFFAMADIYGDTGASIYLKGWLYYVTVTVVISIFMDVYNIVQHLRGDKSEIG